MGGILPLRLSFDRPGSELFGDSVSRNSLWLSGVPPGFDISNHAGHAKGETQGCHHIEKGEYCEPSIRRFFSGKRFPFATLSSIDDQIFFLGPSLLDGRLLVPEPALRPGLLLDIDIADHASDRADHSNLVGFLGGDAVISV
jgi:hypothetical protein